MYKNTLVYDGTDMKATFDIDPNMTVYSLMEEVVAPLLLSMGYSSNVVLDIIKYGVKGGKNSGKPTITENS